MAEQSVFVTYSSPKSKRKLARGVFYVCAILAALIIWAAASNAAKRKEKGYPPPDVTSLVPMMAPLMLMTIGLWIGWAQVRIDMRRGVVERRPLGLRFLFSRSKSISTAKRIYVGYYRAPTTVATANAGVVLRDTGKGTPFWYARVDGPDFQMMLIVQRPKEEALAFAQKIGEKFDLPVEVADDPE